MEDIKLLGDRVRKAEQMVATDNYQKKTNWPLCSAKWCPYFQGCQVDGTLSGEPALLKIRMHQQLNMEQLSQSNITTNTTEEVNIND
jgi:hypothetical protein